jgi:uncharacterized protein (TIRG00374 family)
MKQKAKKGLILGLKLALATGIIGLFVFGGQLDLGSIKRVLTTQPGWLAAGGLALGGPILLSAWRWQILLAAQEVKIGYFLALRLTFVGMFFSTFIPGSTGGDLVKAYYVWRGGRKRTASVTTVFLDRVLGLYCMVGFGAAMVLVQWRAVWAHPQTRPLLFAVPAIFLAATVFFIVLFLPPVRRLAEAAESSSVIPFGKVVNQVYQALDMYRERKTALMYAVLLSVGLNVFLALGFVAYGKALGDSTMTLALYFLAAPLAMVVNGIPVLPMGIGQGEAAFHFLFGALAGSPNGAEACVLMRIVTLAWAAVGAVFYLGMKGTDY